MTNVETAEEAFVSTERLFQYVSGEEFLKNCGSDASTIMCEWLRGPFFSVQNQLLFHFRVSMRNFDEYVNSVCEGQNSAAKTTNTGTKVFHAEVAINTVINVCNCLPHCHAP